MTVRYAGVSISSWAGIKELLYINGLEQAVLNCIYDTHRRVVSIAKVLSASDVIEASRDAFT